MFETVGMQAGKHLCLEALVIHHYKSVEFVWNLYARYTFGIKYQVLRFLSDCTQTMKRRSLMYGFHVAHNNISCIVCEVCSAVIEEYQEDCLIHHAPRMDSDSQHLQSEMAVSSCPGSPGWKTCRHSWPKKGCSL